MRNHRIGVYKTVKDANNLDADIQAEYIQSVINLIDYSLQPDISEVQKEKLIAKAMACYKHYPCKNPVGVLPNRNRVKTILISGKSARCDGISDIHVVSDEYKLVSKEVEAKPTPCDLGDMSLLKDGENGRSSPSCSKRIRGAKSGKVVQHLRRKNDYQMMPGGRV